LVFIRRERARPGREGEAWYIPPTARFFTRYLTEIAHYMHEKAFDRG
jgi:hypothetical protein